MTSAELMILGLVAVLIDSNDGEPAVREPNPNYPRSVVESVERLPRSGRPLSPEMRELLERIR